MLLTDFSIKRPVFSIALSLMIVVVGLLSYTNLAIQQFPSVEEPVLTVTTIYRGAAPEIMETKITDVLEESLSDVQGLDYMESSSKTGESTITLHFLETMSMLEAAVEVREKLGQTQALLPKDCLAPTVSKTDPNDQPFMYLMVTSPLISELELYDYANRNLKRAFESLPGVGNVALWGNNITMQVRLDREKLKAYNLAVTDVINAITQGSKELPSGSIVKGKRYVNVVVDAAVNTPQSMGELVIKNVEGHLIRVRDVATISLDKDQSEFETYTRCNKEPVVFMAIKKAFGGNILSISKAIQQLLKTFRDSLPKDMRLEIGFDVATFIDASIKAVTSTIIEAIVLVLLIILFFLHSFRAALIPLLTIPISLIGSFIFLYAFHCSLNTITLLAMVLAIGLVVDDAIVVLENIHHHIERGLQPLEAALKGAREIGFAVIAMTCTLASVYAPIAFIHGLTGKLFAEFAVALAGAVLISGIVALTLSPMMCAKLLKPEGENPNKISKWIEEKLATLQAYYQTKLHQALARPKLLLGIACAVILVEGFLFYKLPAELAPIEDEGLVFASIQGPSGATLSTMSEYAYKLEDILAAVPERQSVFMVIQRAKIFGGITLKPWEKRKRSFMEIVQDLSVKAFSIPGVQTFVFPPPGLLTGGETGFQAGIKTTQSYTDLNQVMEKLIKDLKASPCFDRVTQTLLLGTPQLMVNIDRQKAAILDVTIEDISKTLETMLSGNRDFKFAKEGRHYDIIIRSKDEHAKDLSDIGGFYARSQSTKSLIPLNSIVSLKEIAVPNELKHLNKMRVSILEANLAPSCHMAQALTTATKALKHDLPSAFQWEPLGLARKYIKSQGSMYLIFVAALFFIYLVLAIQFESLIDPLLIMVTVPLSMAGALLALYLTGCTFNIFSQVGLITLVGLITKHGILLVEFAKKRQLIEKLTPRQAILEAAKLRLRPILMTTGAMVLGATPLALAMGAGAESRQQIGWVLVGGLSGGTLFTLFLLPFVYVTVKEWDTQQFLKAFRRRP